MRKTSIVLAAVLAATVGFALAYGSRDVGASAPLPKQTDLAANLEMTQQEEEEQKLPPNHPAIDMNAAASNANDDTPSLKWTAPKDWSAAPNPNPMRLATYKLPRNASDREDTELVVSRAGGDAKMNIARWASQFDGAQTPSEKTKTVHGLKVTVVEIAGTYQGGMGPQTGSHAGWAMLGAIVETAGEHYFFKVIGPAATVKAAEKPFDTMIDAITS